MPSRLVHAYRPARIRFRLAWLPSLTSALLLFGCGVEPTSPAPSTAAPSVVQTTTALSSPVAVDQSFLASAAIDAVVTQGVAFASSQLPPTRNLHVDIVNVDGNSAQAAARFEVWNAATQAWDETSIDVSLKLVAGGWRISKLGPVVAASTATAIAEATSTAATATQTSVSAQAATGEFTIRTSSLVQTPGVGIAAPVSVTNHDVHDHSIAVTVEVDVLLRDPAATGWWTLTGTVAASVPAGSTQSVVVELTDAPYAFSDEQAAVLKLLQTEPPADSTEARASITSVDGVAGASATPSP